MAKEMGKGAVCNCPHHKIYALVLLVVGILFLLQGMGKFAFWNLDWWTVAFILIGLGKLAGCRCCSNNHMMC